MARSPRPGAPIGSPEWLRRVKEGTRKGLATLADLKARNAELERLLYSRSPADITALRETGVLPESAHPFADCVATTIRRLRIAVEGEPVAEDEAEDELKRSRYHPLSEQKIALLETAERLLLLGMLEMVRGLEGDSESSARAGTLFGKFAALVKDTLGLDPPEHVYPTPLEYAARKAPQIRAGGPIDADPGAQTLATEEDAASAPTLPEAVNA
jgi:hypothetical protein